MSRVLNHDDAFVLLDAAALDALDPAELDAVMAHVRDCDECRAELETLRVTASQLAFAAPLAADTATASRGRIRARLMARAGAERATDARATDERATDERATAERATRTRMINVLAWRRAEWMSIAASVLMVASVGLLAWTLRDREYLREALRSEIAHEQRVRTSGDSLRLAVMARDSVIAGLTGRNVAMMTLTSGGTNAPFARMFWDQAHNTWTLVAHNMPALKPGRTYQLWLVTASAKVSAGTFDPHDGDAMVRATYAVAPADLKALAVTEEPAGGMPQPTGSMVLAVSAR